MILCCCNEYLTLPLFLLYMDKFWSFSAEDYLFLNNINNMVINSNFRSYKYKSVTFFFFFVFEFLLLLRFL